ncbi:NTP transferase domain-containing protein [Patescibacteria group bacterium]|nr:NTP transferase domain-containing protein [Patescibacteria group bacterium]
MQAVVIAAGNSSRFWPLNNGHKCEIFLFGKPIIAWTLKGLAENGVEEAVVVCGPSSRVPELLEKEDLGLSISFVTQEEPLGPGNALWQAKDKITGPFFLVWADKMEAGELVERFKEKAGQADMVLLGTEAARPSEYGVFRMEGENVLSIVEKPAPGTEPSRIVRAVMELLPLDIFTVYENLPSHHEGDLVDALNKLLKQKKAVLVKEEQVSSLKYPWDLFSFLERFAQEPFLEESIASTASVAPSAVLKGPVFVGENASIGEHTLVEGPCYIGPECVIGPSNVLRGPLCLERGVKTGAFCEIKKSIVQEGTHFHSGYVGDSVFGKNCRVAAGFVSANRRLDRQQVRVSVKEEKVDTLRSYLGTVVGEGARIGISCSTMPGVFLGRSCVLGPGSRVFKHVGDEETFSSP